MVCLSAGAQPTMTLDRLRTFFVPRMVFLLYPFSFPARRDGSVAARYSTPTRDVKLRVV